MNTKKTTSAWLLCLTMVFSPGSPLRAADGNGAAGLRQEGSITGRVQNAVTGQYLYRARISIKGSDRVVFTDESGIYRLADVPAGPVTLQVFYTDLDVQEIPVVVSTGLVEQDVGLTSVARYGAVTQVLKLDPFLVASNKETDAEAIATNEQRFAPNIKNVIATESLGDIVGASAGDFLKFMPGLVAEYDHAEVQAISIRGIGADLTSVEIDGAPVVSSGHGGPNRSVNLIPQAINNLTRIEITKVPTPANPADALAGSVNMISKTAFERSGAELRYGVNLTGNFNAFTLERTPHPYRDDNTHKIVPGFDFDYTLPIGKNFGIVITAMSSSTYNSQTGAARIWNSAGTATNASFSQPYLQSLEFSNSPRHRGRSFYGFKADWRVTPNSVLTIGGRLTRTVSARTGGASLTLDSGTNANPTPTTGTRFSYGPDFTNGATGRGSVTIDGTRQLGRNNGSVMDLHYRFDDGRWKLSSSVNYAKSEALLNYGVGAFSGITAVLAVPVRVAFSDYSDDSPSIRDVQVFDSANQPVDIYNINNYRMTTASQNSRRNLATTRFGKLDLGRRLNMFAVPTSVQVGMLRRVQTRDSRWQASPRTFVGANHSAAPYVNRVFVENHEIDNSGLRDVPGVSPIRAWEAFQANPALLNQTTAQMVTEATTPLSSSEYAEESVTSYYLQGEVRLLNNRLNVLAGVRFEDTEVGGEGLLVDTDAIYIRHPDGTFAHDAQGARIRKPEAGAANSVEQALLTRTERGYSAERSYDGYFPAFT